MALQLGSINAALTLDISQFTGNAKQAESAMASLGAAGDRTGGVFSKIRGTALGIGDVLAAPFLVGIKAASDLEQNLANLNASLGGVDSSTLDHLATIIQDLGAASKFSANDVALVADELAKAGFAADKIAGGSLKTIVDLAQATGESLGVATSGVIQAMNLWNPALVGVQTGLNDVTQAADIFTIAANASAGGVQDIIGGLINFGGAAVSVGLSFEDTAAAIAYFNNMGFSGAEAGTKLARAVQMLANPTEDAAKWLNRMGVEAFDAQGKFIGFPALFDQLNKGIGDLTDRETQEAFKTIFGAEAYDAMILGAKSGGDSLRDLRTEFNATGVAAEQSKLRMNTLSAQFDALKEGAETLLAAFAKGLVPVFRLLVDAGNAALDVFMKIPDPIKQVIGLVGGSLAMFSIATRAIQGFQAIQGLLTALGGGATAARFSFAALAGSLGLVVAALAALTIAYSYNFLGFRDFVGKVVDGGRGILNFFRDLKTGWDGIGKVFTGGAPAIKQATSPLSALSRALGGTNGELQETAEAAGGTWEEFSKFEKATYAAEYALSKLIDNNNAPKWLRNTARGLRAAIPNIRNFGKFLGDIWSGSPRKAMESLELLPPSLQKIAKNIAPAVTGVRDLVSAFQIGGFSSLVREIPQAFDMIGDSIRAFVSDMTGGLSIKDWALDIAAPKITGWLADIAGNVWDGLVDVAGWAWDGLVQLGAWTIQTAIPAIAGAIWTISDDVWGWIKAAVGWVWGGVQELGSWSLNVVAPKLVGWALSAASWIISKLTNLVNGGGIAGDGTQGATLGPQVSLGEWFLDVLAPKILAFTWSAAKLIKDAIGIVVVELPTWALFVGTPHVILLGWDVVAEILHALGTVTINLTDVIAKLDGNQVAYQMVNLGASLTKAFVANMPKIVAVAATGLTLLLVGAPLFALVLVGGLAAYVLKKIVELMPSRVTLEAQRLIIAITNLEIQMFTLAAEIIKAVWAVTGGFAVNVAEIIIKIGAYKFESTIDLGASLVLWAIGQIVDTTVYLASLTVKILALSFTTALKMQADLKIWVVGQLKDTVASLSSLTVDITKIGFSTALDLLEVATLWVKNNFPTEISWNVLIKLVPTFGSDHGDDPVDWQVEESAGIGNVPSLDFSKAIGSTDGAGSLKDVLGRAIENAKTAAEGKMRELDTVINTGLTTTASTITTGVAGWGTAFGAGLQPILTVVNATFVTAIPANVQSGMTASVTAITSGMATSTSAIDNATSRWQSVVQSSTRTMQSATTSSMQAMVAAIGSAMATATGRIQSESGRWPGIVSGTAGAMRNAGYGAGAAAGDGVVNGLLSRLSAVRSAANEIARTVDAAIAKSLQIHSPSRVTYELGRQAGIGFATGIADQIDHVTTSSTSLAAAAASGISRRYPVDPTTGEVYRPGHPGPYPDNLIWPDGMSKDIGTVIGDRVSDVIRDRVPDTVTTTPKTEKEPNWKDLMLTGIRQGLGEGFDTSVSTLWNEADWLARVEKLGEQAARDINSLFIGRTRVSDTDYTLLGGKYREHYGSGILPDMPKTPPPPPPPPPDVPNNGSPHGGTRPGNSVPAVQQTTIINQALRGDELMRVLDGTAKGITAHGAIQQMGTRRTMQQGSSRLAGRM